MISDRTFLDLSSKMMEPLCEGYRALRYNLVAPLEFCDSTTSEIARRTLICVGAVIGSLLICTYPLPVLAGVAFIALGGKVLRALGFALQTQGFTHVLGHTTEKVISDGKVKLMTWNICGLAGGFSFDHGGVLPWRDRFDEIIKTVKIENPDVLVLQEIVDTDLAEAIIAKLNTDYAHFFIHLGPSIWGVGSGCMVLSKCAVHDFSFTSFSTNDWTLNRGFASLEIKEKPEDEKPCLRILGTHLIHGKPEEAHSTRMSQLAQMIDSIAQKTLLPTIITGDLNIERDEKEGEDLTPILHHAYLSSDYTCTNKLLAQWDGRQHPEELIDFISAVKGLPEIAFEHVHIVPAHEPDYNPLTARSDHHGLVGEIIFKPSI